MRVDVMRSGNKIIFYLNGKRKYCIPYKRLNEHVILLYERVPWTQVWMIFIDGLIMYDYTHYISDFTHGEDIWNKEGYLLQHSNADWRPFSPGITCSFSLPKCRKAIFTLLLAAKRKLLVFPRDLTKIICHKIYTTRYDEEWE